MTELVLIALGSNVGARAAYLSAARAAIGSLPRTRLVAASQVEETAPFGSGPQGPYLNQMVLAATTLGPRELLECLHRVERMLGRTRSRRWGARTIDLDIVRYGHRASRSRDLLLPHPGLANRDFWQREISELERVARYVA